MQSGTPGRLPPGVILHRRFRSPAPKPSPNVAGGTPTALSRWYVPELGCECSANRCSGHGKSLAAAAASACSSHSIGSLLARTARRFVTLQPPVAFPTTTSLGFLCGDLVNACKSTYFRATCAPDSARNLVTLMADLPQNAPPATFTAFQQCLGNNLAMLNSDPLQVTPPDQQFTIANPWIAINLFNYDGCGAWPGEQCSGSGPPAAASCMLGHPSS